MSRPPFDPWLAHLRRDRRGLPVPYVNLWGEQTIDNTRLRHCTHARGPGLFVDDDPNTDPHPDFTRMSMQRQRECMASGLCQVCHRPAPWSRRNLIVTGFTVDFVPVPDLGRRSVGCIHESWMDDRCVAIATAWCPALIRAAAAGSLHILPVRSAREVRLVTSYGWTEGHLEQATRQRPAAMWIKAVLLGWNLIPAGGQ